MVLCVNDRVGLPRPLNPPGRDSFQGVVADGTCDSLAGGGSSGWVGWLVNMRGVSLHGGSVKERRMK